MATSYIARDRERETLGLFFFLLLFYFILKDREPKINREIFYSPGSFPKSQSVSHMLLTGTNYRNHSQLVLIVCINRSWIQAQEELEPGNYDARDTFKSNLSLSSHQEQVGTFISQSFRFYYLTSSCTNSNPYLLHKHQEV